MRTLESLEKTPLGDALLELSERIEREGLGPIELDVCGGFALILRGHRDPASITDIDYIGPDLPARVSRIADEVGIAHGLGTGWVNNDVLMAGATLEDLEFATGPLDFEEAFSTPSVKVRVLTDECLLRMKLIAVDTALMACEAGGDFTRSKDLPDICELSSSLGIDPAGLGDRYSEYLVCSSTAPMVSVYAEQGEDAFQEALRDRQIRALERMAGRERKRRESSIGFDGAPQPPMDGYQRD